MVFSCDNLPYKLKIGLMNLNSKNMGKSFRNCFENKYDYFVGNIFDKDN